MFFSNVLKIRYKKIFKHILILSMLCFNYTNLKYNNQIIMENFSKNLKEVRMQKGLSQKQMAELLGVSYRTYQNYELMTREPKLEILIRIADLYNVSLDYLVGRTDKK